MRNGKKARGNVRRRNLHRHSLILMACDLLLLVLAILAILVVNPSENTHLQMKTLLCHFALSAAAVFACRIAGGLYVQVWRYYSTILYIRLMLLDLVAGWLYFLLQRAVLPWTEQVLFIRAVSLIALNLLLTISVRMIYQFLYEYSSRTSKIGDILRRITARVTGRTISPVYGGAGTPGGHRINIAIVGAGRVGVMLAEELANNPHALYRPCCFIDTDEEKIGRFINGLQVLSETEATWEELAAFPVQELVFALPELDAEKKKQLYERYSKSGCKIKVYDYPTAQSVENGRRMLREFDVEELLFRSPVELPDSETHAYYRGKTVLISGGGGSIGSELCRQIARMQPRRLVILDVYENGAYDIQQELAIAFGSALETRVEIVSVCDRQGLAKAFERHRPDIVLHAAAHKHVPLMEYNCCEAVKNNVLGTLNMADHAEEYGVARFIMISTDKAVNPTNVMGATKRMCEMIVQSRAGGRTEFCATRFGNVLGSNGSVIPLFKRQIAGGGPVTLTDKRIIRYFMTIPEASKLVLQSGAMAKSGELYVLDMGKPVRILELAENLIRLSGLEPYRDIQIVETGLRPGEKLYEELLVKKGELEKTGNSLIFVEREKPPRREEIDGKIALLRQAAETGDEARAKDALKKAVPTFRDPGEVNASAGEAGEMRMTEERSAAI